MLLREMSAIFCCTNPRSCSPTAEPEPAIISLGSGSPARRQRKVKRIGPCRRHSRQDIEAFYQEGRRLQKEEVSRDSLNESVFGNIAEGGRNINHAELHDSSIITEK